jgi:hypothetical protein
MRHMSPDLYIDRSFCKHRSLEQYLKHTSSMAQGTSISGSRSTNSALVFSYSPTIETPEPIPGSGGTLGDRVLWSDEEHWNRQKRAYSVAFGG